MSDRTKLGDHLAAFRALVAMRDSDGWQVVCDKFKERFSRLTEQVLNPDTPREEAEVLRQARGRIEREFSPEKLLSDLIAHHESGAKLR